METDTKKEELTVESAPIEAKPEPAATEQSVEEEKPKTSEEQTKEKLEDNGIDPDSKYGKVLIYIEKIGKYLKIPLLSLLTCSGFFILIYLIAWTLNAMHSDMHFDLNSLRDFYLYVIGAKSVDHGVDSIFNTPRGAFKPPTQ